MTHPAAAATLPALTILAPAKINVVLAVGPVEVDGYHRLATLFQTVSLYDQIRLTPAAAFDLVVSGPAAAGVPADDRNLALRAARLYFRRVGPPPGSPGLRIEVEKSIPAAAGLAGGSSDAAAVLRGLAHWGRESRDATELQALAAELGADVPFLLQGGTMAGYGRGERLEPLPALPPRPLLLAKPEGQLSTAEVYDGLDALGPGRGDPTLGPAWQGVLAAAREGRADGVWAAAHNDLEAVAAQRLPGLRRLLDFGRRSDAWTGLSGSGPAVWLVPRQGEAGRTLAKRLEEQGWWVRWVEPTPAVPPPLERSVIA